MKAFLNKLKARLRRLRHSKKTDEDEATVESNTTIYSGDPSKDARHGNLMPPVPGSERKLLAFTERSAKKVIDGGDDLRQQSRTGDAETEEDIKGTGHQFSLVNNHSRHPKYLHVDEEYNGQTKHLDQCKNRLREESCIAYDGQNWYIPVDALENVLTAETVSSILHECVPQVESDNISDHVSTICGTGLAKFQKKAEFRKILAILIMSDQCHRITDFMSGDLSDDLLPS